MTRRICLITGTTHGIGTVTARELARAGGCVVMANRNQARASVVRDHLIKTTGNDDIHLLPLDLASFVSVRACVDAFCRQFERLDLLVNNAGLMSVRRQHSADGIELQFAVNHLGPFLLTNLLLDRLRASAPARIVVVASRAHRRGAMHIDNPPDGSPRDERYSGMRAYSRSKLANVMFTLALARRLAGSGVTANCLHPGVVATNIVPGANALVRAGVRFAKRFMLTEEEGAKTSLYLAMSPAVDGVTGGYFDEHQKPQAPSKLACDETLQERLWELSMKLTGLATPRPRG